MSWHCPSLYTTNVKKITWINETYFRNKKKTQNAAANEQCEEQNTNGLIWIITYQLITNNSQQHTAIKMILVFCHMWACWDQSVITLQTTFRDCLARFVLRSQVNTVHATCWCLGRQHVTERGSGKTHLRPWFAALSPRWRQSRHNTLHLI